MKANADDPITPPSTSSLRLSVSSSLFKRLYIQVFLAILLGIAMGYFFPTKAQKLQPLGPLFIQLIRMVLGPIIFSTVVVGIARMENLKSVGRVGAKSLIYFEVVSTMALLIGLVVVNLFHPGSGMNIDPHSLDTKSLAALNATPHPHTVIDFLLSIVPSSAAGAFVDGNILQVIFFSLLFGVALAQLGPRGKPLVDILDLLLHTMFGIVRIVMYLAPIAAFGAMAFTVGKFGAQSLGSYAKLIACLYLTALTFIFVVLGTIARLSGVSIWRFLVYIGDEIAVCFATCSTESVLPQMLEKMEKLGCEKSVVGLVLPAGYAFNLDGTSIYLTMAAIFIAQATRTPLTLMDQLLVLAVLLLTSKGSGGVAGAGLVTLAATLASMDKIPFSGLVLLIGIESLLNQARACTNLIGNGIATIAVAKWENALDITRMHAELNSPPQALAYNSNHA